MASERIGWVDIARIIAIALIVGFHLLYALQPEQGLRPIGFIGASLFFIISGFMLANRYPDLAGFDFGWLKKRFVRIASIYYPALIAMALLFPAYNYYRGLYDLALHFLFLNWISHDTAFSIISAGWFIVPLIALYALFPMLNRMMRSNTLNGSNAIFLYAAFSLELANRIIIKDLVSFSPVFFIGEFCFGMAIANGERRWWVLAAALLPAAINPMMLMPFVLFLALNRFFGSAARLPRMLSLVAENTFEIFLFHEALIMVALGRWDIYGQCMSVTLAILALSIIAVKMIANWFRNRYGH